MQTLVSLSVYYTLQNEQPIKLLQSPFDSNYQSIKTGDTAASIISFESQSLKSRMENIMSQFKLLALVVQNSVLFTKYFTCTVFSPRTCADQNEITLD